LRFRNDHRNGYRHRDFDARTGTGTLDVAIPKLRTGTYFPDWLLELPRIPRTVGREDFGPRPRNWSGETKPAVPPDPTAGLCGAR